MFGLPKGVFRLEPYSSLWRTFFEKEKMIIEKVLESNFLEIRHVGSTSIPGMVAKPIIDIAIAVKQFEEARVCIEPLVQLGYQFRGEHGLPRRHYFGKVYPETYHIHMLEINSSAWRSMLLFRKYLINHPEIAREYCELKQKLVNQPGITRLTYFEGKAPFIRNVLRLAKNEFSS